MNIFHEKSRIAALENKVSKNIGILYKAKNIFSKVVLKSLYFFSYIEYCLGKLATIKKYTKQN